MVMQERYEPAALGIEVYLWRESQFERMKLTCREQQRSEREQAHE